MYYVLYASSATEPFTSEKLRALLAQSQTDNAPREITGMLLYKDGNFMQVLEGEKETVRALYDKIGRDPRHTGVITFLEGETVERQFPNWSMAFRDLNSPEILSLPGYSEFLNFPLTGNEFATDPSRCQRLLMTFKKHLR